MPADRLSEKSIEPSGLSLHGLVRHLTGVERWWLRMQFGGEDLPMIYYSDDDPDQDFESLDGDVGEALAAWRSECEHSRAAVAERPHWRTPAPRSGPARRSRCGGCC